MPTKIQFQTKELKCKRVFSGKQLRSMYEDTTDNSQYFNVENRAVKYYHEEEGWDCMHAGNSLFKHLFGLLFWNEIYDSKIDYVF